MSEAKERSGIFKFFYIFFSIISSPIFALLFILRHPIWVLVVLALVVGGAAYWPMSKHNVKLSEVVDWYKGQYQNAKFDIAKKAMSDGASGYVPKVVLDEMKKIEEEAEEAKLPKSDNYNAKVVRDRKSEDLKAMMKKRGGFKKKGEIAATKESIEASEQTDVKDAELEVQEGELAAPDGDMPIPQSGGLSALLLKKAEPAENVQTTKTDETDNVSNVAESDKGKIADKEDDDGFDLLGEDDEVENTPTQSKAEPVEVEQPVIVAQPVKESSNDDEDDELDLF